MITIRKKLAEQAANSQQKGPDGKEIKRRPSIRSQLLTAGKIDTMYSELHCLNASCHTFLIEVSELGDVLPSQLLPLSVSLTLKHQVNVSNLLSGNCKIYYDNPDDLKKFRVVIKPEEGYWRGGTFKFEITVPPDYNNKVFFS